MTVSDIYELESLWDFFSVPRAQTEVNKKLLQRLKYLATLKLRSEYESK